MLPELGVHLLLRRDSECTRKCLCSSRSGVQQQDGELWQPPWVRQEWIRDHRYVLRKRMMMKCPDAMPSDLNGRFLPQKSKKNKSMPISEYPDFSEIISVSGHRMLNDLVLLWKIFQEGF